MILYQNRFSNYGVQAPPLDESKSVIGEGERSPPQGVLESGGGDGGQAPPWGESQSVVRDGEIKFATMRRWRIRTQIVYRGRRN